MTLYRDSDYHRLRDEERQDNNGDGRSEFRRDYGRLLHSASFRRLQGKTQLFPGDDSDYFRNRLTHSLEVAQVAHCIADRLNKQHSFFSTHGTLDTDLVEFAALAHDLGHPPFGHNGEIALNNLMSMSGGFEGNAQTLRILIRLSKKVVLGLPPNLVSLGLNLTMRAICAVLKYDSEIPLVIPPKPSGAKKKDPKRRAGEREHKVVKGYYGEDAAIVNAAKLAVVGSRYSKKIKTIECYIMDIADDIAYSTYDLEDALKAGFLTPLDLIVTDPEVEQELFRNVNAALDKEGVSPRTLDDIKSKLREIVALFGPLPYDSKSPPALNYARASSQAKEFGAKSVSRTSFSSTLIDRFVGRIVFKPNRRKPCLSIVRLDDETRLEVEVLKRLTYLLSIRSHRLRIVENRGKEIVTTIFQRIQRSPELMPDDFWATYKSLPKKDSASRNRVICDFVSGMTDRYAVEFYARLTSEEHRTIFKPM